MPWRLTAGNSTPRSDLWAWRNYSSVQVDPSNHERLLSAPPLRLLHPDYLVATPMGTAKVMQRRSRIRTIGGQAIKTYYFRLQLLGSRCWMSTSLAYRSIPVQVGSHVLMQAWRGTPQRGKVIAVRPPHAVVRLYTWRLADESYVQGVFLLQDLQVMAPKNVSDMTVLEQLYYIAEGKEAAYLRYTQGDSAAAAEAYRATIAAIRLVLAMHAAETRSVRGNLFLTLILCATTAAKASGRLEHWPSVASYCMDALRLLKLLETKAKKQPSQAVTASNRRQRLHAMAKTAGELRVFGVWRVHALQLLALALIELAEIDPAIGVLQQAHKIVEKYRPWQAVMPAHPSPRELQLTADCTKRVAQLQRLDRWILKRYARLERHRKSERKRVPEHVEDPSGEQSCGVSTLSLEFDDDDDDDMALGLDPEDEREDQNWEAVQFHWPAELEKPRAKKEPVAQPVLGAEVSVAGSSVSGWTKPRSAAVVDISRDVPPLPSADESVAAKTTLTAGTFPIPEDVEEESVVVESASVPPTAGASAAGAVTLTPLAVGREGDETHDAKDEPATPQRVTPLATSDPPETTEDVVTPLRSEWNHSAEKPKPSPDGTLATILTEDDEDDDHSRGPEMPEASALDEKKVDEPIEPDDRSPVAPSSLAPEDTARVIEIVAQGGDLDALLAQKQQEAGTDSVTGERRSINDYIFSYLERCESQSVATKTSAAATFVPDDPDMEPLDQKPFRAREEYIDYVKSPLRKSATNTPKSSPSRSFKAWSPAPTEKLGLVPLDVDVSEAPVEETEQGSLDEGEVMELVDTEAVEPEKSADDAADCVAVSVEGATVALDEVVPTKVESEAAMATEGAAPIAAESEAAAAAVAAAALIQIPPVKAPVKSTFVAAYTPEEIEALLSEAKKVPVLEPVADSKAAPEPEPAMPPSIKKRPEIKAWAAPHLLHKNKKEASTATAASADRDDAWRESLTAKAVKNPSSSAGSVASRDSSTRDDDWRATLTAKVVKKPAADTADSSTVASKDSARSDDWRVTLTAKVARRPEANDVGPKETTPVASSVVSKDATTSDDWRANLTAKIVKKADVTSFANGSAVATERTAATKVQPEALLSTGSIDEDEDDWRKTREPFVPKKSKIRRRRLKLKTTDDLDIGRPGRKVTFSEDIDMISLASASTFHSNATLLEDETNWYEKPEYLLGAGTLIAGGALGSILAARALLNKRD